jgi:hypothetical protein
MIDKSVELDVVYLKGVECSKVVGYSVIISLDFKPATVSNRFDFELGYMVR